MYRQQEVRGRRAGREGKGAHLRQCRPAVQRLNYTHAAKQPTLRRTGSSEHVGAV